MVSRVYGANRSIANDKLNNIELMLKIIAIKRKRLSR